MGEREAGEVGAGADSDSGAGHLTSAGPSEASTVVALTPDEIVALLEELRGFHDESDFEPECPACWAFKKLQAAHDALAERSAAPTGADTDRHGSNDLNSDSPLPHHESADTGPHGSK